MIQELLSFLVVGSAHVARCLVARNGFGCAASLALPHTVVLAIILSSSAALSEVTIGALLGMGALSAFLALLQWAA